MARYYTVHDRKTENVVASGSAQKCAGIMSRSLHSFDSMITRTRNGEHKKYIVVIEDDNDTETIGS